jgi:hypothetical protein
LNNLSLIDRFLSPSTSKKFAFAYPRLLLWSVVTLAILVRSLNQGILIPSGYLFAVLPVLLVVFTLQLFGMIAMRVSTSEFFVTVSSLVHIVSAVLLSRSVGVGNSIWGIVLLVEAVILGLTLPLLNGLSVAPLFEPTREDRSALDSLGECRDVAPSSTGKVHPTQNHCDIHVFDLSHSLGHLPSPPHQLHSTLWPSSFSCSPLPPQYLHFPNDVQSGQSVGHSRPCIPSKNA